MRELRAARELRVDELKERVVRSLLRSVETARSETRSYEFWILERLLPEALARELSELPMGAPLLGDSCGRRETFNGSRTFFSPEVRARHPVAEAVAGGFQDPRVVAALQRLTRAPLTAAYTRVEYCQDRDGFWLEPHLDISAKKMSLIAYLSQAPGSEDWGTDIYGPDLEPLGRCSAHWKSAFLFIPGADTWHGFEPRRIDGVRKSLIVNYVGQE